jgi:hypothetical protein
MVGSCSKLEGGRNPMTRIRVIAGLLAAVSLGAVAAASTPASATVSTGRAGSGPAAISRGGCSGDVCVTAAPADAPGSVIIFYAANTKAFRGHFRLLGPDHVSATSPTRTWPAHGLDHLFPAYWTTVLRPHKGYYCVSGYKTNGVKVGRACVRDS